MGFIENIANAMRAAASSETAEPEAPNDGQGEKTEPEASESSAENIEAPTDEAPTENKTYTEEDFQKAIQEREDKWNKERLESLSQEDQIRELKSQLFQKEMKDKLYARLEEVKLPIGVAEFVKYSDEAGTMENLEKVIATVNQLVVDATNLRLRGKTPIGLGGGSLIMETLQKSDEPFAKTFIEAMKKERGL